jgi:glycerol kinase
LITGITRGTTAAHVARATLEAIAFQVDDLVRAMERDLEKPSALMRVDGGAAANDLLLQLQSDVSGITVERPTELESTARGAAMLAGLGAGLYRDAKDAARVLKLDRRFETSMSADAREAARKRWNDAVRRARSPAAH